MIVALVIALAASAVAVSHLTNERAALLRQRIPHWEVCRCLTSEIEPRNNVPQLVLNFFCCFFFVWRIGAIGKLACVGSFDEERRRQRQFDKRSAANRKKKKKKKSHKENLVTHTQQRKSTS
jgi:hypothetical protein